MTGIKPDKGWAWIVLLGSFGVHVVNGCFLFCSGIVHAALLERFEQSVTFTSWTTSLAVCLMASAGPLASVSINRFNCRITTIIGGIIITIGCLASAFMTSLEWLIVTYSIITGTGSGITHSASVVAVGFAFDKRRNFASGVAASGVGIGILFLAPAITAAKHSYGYEGFFIIMAGIGFHQILFGFMLRPSYLENRSKYMQRNGNGEKRTNYTSKFLTNFKILTNKSIFCLCISILCWTLGVFLVFLHLPVYSLSKGTTPMEVSFMLGLTGACGCFSRMVTGLAANSENVNELVVYSGSFGLLGIATLFLPLYGATYGGQLVFAAILGMYSGNCYGILSSINIMFVGIENLAASYGVEMFFHGLGALVGPPIAGVIVDGGGTYEQSFYVAGSAITTGAILGMCTTFFKTQHRERSPDAIEYNIELTNKEKDKEESYNISDQINGDINNQTAHLLKGDFVDKTDVKVEKNINDGDDDDNNDVDIDDNDGRHDTTVYLLNSE